MVKNPPVKARDTGLIPEMGRSGTEPMSPALAGGFPSTVPPGKPGFLVFAQEEADNPGSILTMLEFSLDIHLEMWRCQLELN